MTDKQVNQLIDKNTKIQIPKNLYNIGDQVRHISELEEKGIIESVSYNLTFKRYTYGVSMRFGAVYYENEFNLIGI